MWKWICLLCRYTKMKTATNIYIFNLALADALVTSTLPFQSVNYLMGTWPFGDILCKMVMSIDYYNMFTSIFTLTTMSIDRYVAVCHPVKALDFRTPRNAKIVNVCNWILSSAIGLPVMFMASTAVTCKHAHVNAAPQSLAQMGILWCKSGHIMTDVLLHKQWVENK